MARTITSPNDHFLAWRASDRSRLFSIYSLEWRLQKIDTAAGPRLRCRINSRSCRPGAMSYKLGQ
eukprot:14510341-Alexandrium_andersonii.AAC.1